MTAAAAAAADGCHGDGDEQLACDRWLRRSVSLQELEYDAVLLCLLASLTSPTRHKLLHLPSRT